MNDTTPDTQARAELFRDVTGAWLPKAEQATHEQVVRALRAFAGLPDDALFCAACKLQLKPHRWVRTAAGDVHCARCNRAFYGERSARVCQTCRSWTGRSVTVPGAEAYTEGRCGHWDQDIRLADDCCPQWAPKQRR